MSRALALSVVGFALLGVAWMFATPLAESPDESSQYLRALTIADGHLLGPRIGLEPIERAQLREGVGAADKIRWIVPDQRGVVVPAALSPIDEHCFDGRPDLRGRCTEVSYNGDYFPLAYLLPAVVISTTHTWRPAMWGARAASLLPVLVLIALALVLTGAASRWRTVGLMAAITPTVLFIGSVTNPSGLEIAAGLAFIAALLRLRRDGEAFPGWGWAALIVSGAATILAWQLGIVFAALDLAVYAALSSASRLARLWSARRGEVLMTGLILGAASVAFVVWGAVSGVIHPTHVSFLQGVRGLKLGVSTQLVSVLKGAVGIFGQYSVSLPLVMFWLWWLAVILLVLFALRTGPRRDGLVLAAVTLVAIAFPVLMFAFAYQHSGFGLQGRYVIPVLALIPILAGEIIDTGRLRAPPAGSSPLGASPVGDHFGRAAGLCVAGFALLQLVAWWENARHWSGTNALILHHSLWTHRRGGHPGWPPPSAAPSPWRPVATGRVPARVVERRSDRPAPDQRRSVAAVGGPPPPGYGGGSLRHPPGVVEGAPHQHLDVGVQAPELIGRPPGQRVVNRGVEAQRDLLALSAHV